MSMMPFSSLMKGGGGVPPILEVVQFMTGTATTSLDVTDPIFSGTTPIAALVPFAYHLPANDSTETPDAKMSLGAGANEQPRSGVARSQDNVASTNVLRQGNNSSLAEALNSSTNAHLKILGLDSFITNGVRISRGTNGGSDVRCVAGLFGSRVSANNSKLGLGTGTSALSCTTTFQPDVVILYGNNITLASNYGNIFALTFGITSSDGTKYGLHLGENHNQAAGVPILGLTSTYGALQLGFDGALNYGLTVGGFAPTAFTVTPSSSTGGDDIGWLALKFPGAHKLMEFTAPTGTGNFSTTGVGFRPSAAIAVVTSRTAIDTFPVSSTAASAGFSICMFTERSEWSNVIRIKSGADPTDTASNCQEYAMMGTSDSDTKAFLANLVSFDSDGATLNCVAASSAFKGFILFIQ